MSLFPPVAPEPWNSIMEDMEQRLEVYSRRPALPPNTIELLETAYEALNSSIFDGDKEAVDEAWNILGKLLGK